MRGTELQPWRRGTFKLAVESPAGVIEVDGIVHVDWTLGIHFRDDHGIDVTHIPSGRRIARVETLGAAMELVHSVVHMTAWVKVEPEIPPALREIIEAVRASAKRPAYLPLTWRDI